MGHYRSNQAKADTNFVGSCNARPPVLKWTPEELKDTHITTYIQFKFQIKSPVWCVLAFLYFIKLD